MVVHLRLTFIYIRVHFNFAIIYDSPIVLIYVCMFYVKYIETALYFDRSMTNVNPVIILLLCVAFHTKPTTKNVHQIYQYTFSPQYIVYVF